MSNSYFQFKQFTVQQDRCAMKVCTDACLFGAAVASFMKKNEALKILDIGTGTGLLPLMIAQKNDDAVIDTVEIDGATAHQAAENFAASPWSKRLQVHHTSVQDFTLSFGQPIDLPYQSTNQPFDFIISNPPFFEYDLKSPDEKRNIALHGNELGLEELLGSITVLLKDGGVFGVLLPYHRTLYFEKLAAENKFHLSHKIIVKQTPKHACFRSILFFERKETTIVEKEIIIKDHTDSYTPEFIELLKDYYLYL